jgi:tetratricopeptide (TPR) repeat protein
MRTSQAALAFITRVNSSGQTEYLTQWNDGWQAYSLIGGHVEASETFRQCCLREFDEELLCTASDYELAPYPYATLRFREFSKAAREETDYHWQVFMARPGAELLGRLPDDCQWVQAHHIRSGRTPDGKPIADQVRRVLKAVEEAEFDLFVSYGHADDLDGSVTALVEHIRRDHEQFVPTEPMKIFFDIWGIRDGDDWERRIYKGLIESKAMLAVLSPAYFNSQWCRREYDTFVQQQLKKLYPGEPIQAIYIQSHPDFDSTTDHPQRTWFEDLKRRQFTDAKPWWPDGQQALQRDVVSQRLTELRQTIWTRVCDAKAIQHSPSNLHDFNLNFVGREQELAQLWNTLKLNHSIAVSAIQGVGGLGKTALARAYAHSRRREYPGGQFEIAMERIETVAGLRFEVIHLANLYLGAGIPEELINANLDLAFAKAKAAFERPGQGRILLILDNVATDGVLTDRSGSLPSSEFVHVLATTRLDPERWGIPSLRLESLSTADALDLFQKYRPFQPPEDESLWHRVRHGQQMVIETEVDSDEWKAAVGIVNRLGGHALAIEVVAVYLGNNRTITLQNYLRGLINKGLALKLEQAGDDPKVRARLREAIETNISELLRPTFEKLEQECPLAMRALEWAALLPPDHVPWIWLRELVEQDYPKDLQHDPDDPDPWADSVVRVLQGWQLLTGDSVQPSARIHRIVQAALTARVATTGTSADVTEQNSRTLLAYLEQRGTMLGRDWGKPGVNWELTPMHVAAQMLIASLGVRVGPLITCLIQLLRLDGRLLNALTLQEEVIRLQEVRAKRSPDNAEYAHDLSILYVTMGDLFGDVGNQMQAREFWGKSLEVRQRLVVHASENVEYARELSVVYERMGNHFHTVGNWMQARDFYHKSLRVCESLAAGVPDTADYVRSLSVLNNKMGVLFRELGNMVQAREFHEKALEASKHVAAGAPENKQFAGDLSVSYIYLGELLSALGNGAQAHEFYEKAMKVRERLAAGAPENADYSRDLSISYERMGDLFRALGNGVQAREFYEKAMKVRERLASHAPHNVHYANLLSITYNKIGDLLSVAKNLEQAGEFYLKALDISEWLAAVVPEHADFTRVLSLSYFNMGNLFRASGNLVQAGEFYEKALKFGERLVARTPENVNFSRNLCTFYQGTGNLYRALNNFVRARDFYEKALEVCERLAASAPENADYARDLSVSYERMGDLFRALGHGVLAREFYEKALEVRERLAASAPENADYARDLWVSCWRMGSIESDEGQLTAARTWRQRAHEILQGMVDRGLFVSEQDHGFLNQLKQMLEES